LLPATVEYHSDAEDEFVRLVLSGINIEALEFKLTPTYIIYMAVRHRLMHGFRPHVDQKHRAQIVAALTTKVANTTYHTIQVFHILIALFCIIYVIAVQDYQGPSAVITRWKTWTMIIANISFCHNNPMP